MPPDPTESPVPASINRRAAPFMEITCALELTRMTPTVTPSGACTNWNRARLSFVDMELMPPMVRFTRFTWCAAISTTESATQRRNARGADARDPDRRLN